MRYLPIEIDVTEEISLGSDCESGWEATPAIEFKTQATSNCSILADSDVARQEWNVQGLHQRMSRKHRQIPIPSQA